MIDRETYLIERAICDKAQAYARATMLRDGKQTNYMTAEEAKHPDYAACDNTMRGRVEQYELLTNTPDRFGAYVSSDGKHVTTWTGDILGSCHLSSGWRVGGFTTDRMHQAYAWINGRQFTGRTAGKGMFVGLRETAESKRQANRFKPAIAK